MLSNMIITGIAVVLMITLWWLIYGYHATETKSKVALIAAIFVLFFMPYIFKISRDSYNLYSKMYFERNANGVVEVIDTPMKIPPATRDPLAFCQQFTDQNNKPITKMTEYQGNTYCGSYIDTHEEFLTIPYKLLPNKKAEYWTSPNLRIIGNSPKLQD